MNSAAERIYLIVEDNIEMAEMNSFYLKQFDAQANCLVISCPAEARERLRIEQPQMIVVDILYGDSNGQQSATPGLTLLQSICADHCELNVLVYTAEPVLLRPLVQSIQKHRGGFVVVNKLEQRASFISGIRSALQGRHSLTRELNVVADFSQEDQDILCLMCIESLSDKEIARRMNRSVRSIQTRIFRLKEKLAPEAIEDNDKNARMAACQEAFRRRWIS